MLPSDKPDTALLTPPETAAILRRSPKREGAWPRLLRREAAADYLSISASLFDRWIDQKLIPKGKKISGVTTWDRYALDESVETLFYSETDAEMSKWDNVSV